MLFKILKNKKISKKIIEHEFPLFLDLLKYLLFVDPIRRFKNRKDPTAFVNSFYGIKALHGIYGSGKSTTLSYIGTQERKMHGNNIYICSNYGFTKQDFPFTDIEQFTKQYDKPVLWLLDEVQTLFPNNQKFLDKKVLKTLSFNRKCHFKIYWCSQDIELVNKAFRRLITEVGWVKTLFNRYTRVRFFLKEDFEQLLNEVNVDKKIKIHPIKKIRFVQTDALRNTFQSFTFDNGEDLIIGIDALDKK